MGTANRKPINGAITVKRETNFYMNKITGLAGNEVVEEVKHW